MHERVRRYLEICQGRPPIDMNVDNVVGDSRVAVWLLDFPGCIAQGPSISVATKQLWKAIPAYLDALADAGGEFPSAPPAVTVAVERWTEGGAEENPFEIEGPDARELSRQLATTRPTLAAA